jgi:hypothetical protein
MKRLSVPLFAVALGLFAGVNARADILWSYDFTPGTATVISDSGNNSITFTNQPLFNASNNSDVVATNIAVKTPVVGTSDTFTHQNYTIKMYLKDTASGAFTAVPLLFSGDLTGTITPTSTNIVNEFDPAHVTATVTLGSNTYTATIGNYTPPGPAGSIPGSFSVHVTVVHNGGHEPPPTNDVPEPSTMLLSCLGLAGLGLRAWRKRRLAQA